MVDHCPVLLEAMLAYLSPKPGSTIVDATVSVGGYANAILRAMEGRGRVIGIDLDEEALCTARERLAGWGDAFVARKANFADLPDVLDELGVPAVDGLVSDLGVSSCELLDGRRGFSLRLDGPLDMRMDPKAPRSAADLVNSEPEESLEQILREYGEERYARRVAGAIVARRRVRPIRTTLDLADVVRGAVPGRRGRLDKGTLTFQALRIATNDELTNLRRLCNAAPGMLKPNAVFCCVSYHSLEDRIVKEALNSKAPTSPWEPLTRKPVTPTAAEVAANRRARSAKLRAARRKPLCHSDS